MLERTQVVPNVYSGYYKDGDRNIVAEADERYMQNLSAWQEFFWEQLIDRKVYLGDQRNLNSYTGLSYEQLKFVFNNSKNQSSIKPYHIRFWEYAYGK